MYSILCYSTLNSYGVTCCRRPRWRSRWYGGDRHVYHLQCRGPTAGVRRSLRGLLGAADQLLSRPRTPRWWWWRGCRFTVVKRRGQPTPTCWWRWGSSQSWRNTVTGSKTCREGSGSWCLCRRWHGRGGGRVPVIVFVSGSLRCVAPVATRCDSMNTYMHGCTGLALEAGTMVWCRICQHS